MSKVEPSRTAHTPEPWSLLFSQVRGRPRCLFVDEKGNEIASINPFRESWNGDARLIAAAPEMFAAIQGALRIADLWRPSEDWPEEHREEAEALYMMLSQFEKLERKVLGTED